jgi:hypothetical protein
MLGYMVDGLCTTNLLPHELYEESLRERSGNTLTGMFLGPYPLHTSEVFIMSLLTLPSQILHPRTRPLPVLDNHQVRAHFQDVVSLRNALKVQ